MKVGDKIRFLNAVGGGVVKGFKGRDVALVEDEDGFEIPILIRECVVIDPNYEMQSKQSSQNIIEEIEIRQEIEEEVEIIETKEGNQLSVLLAFVANDIKNISRSDYACYLINDSNYYLSYAYMTRSELGWETRSVGMIEPNIKLYLEEFTKDDLNNMEQACIQFIAYKKDKPFDLKNSVNVELRIDPIKFYKLHSFKDNEYFDEPAIVYPIVSKDRPAKEIQISPEEVKEALFQKEIRPRKQAIKKVPKGEILEIDLHIHELLDSTTGLTATDMLEIQLKKFHEVINENLKDKGQKIVFIHGKGNGVLKSAIYKELKTKYKTIFYQDASFQQYGYGATMITIK